MVVLNRIYTRTGDDGRPRSAAASGARNTICGSPPTAPSTRSTRSSASRGCTRRASSQLDAMLARIQNDLFDVGADLCMPDKGKGPGGARLDVTEPRWSGSSSRSTRSTPSSRRCAPSCCPGGSAAAAYLHLARTVCRRAERLIVELKDKPGESVTPAAIKYVNRLSDFFFVAARFANDKGAADVLWVPGQNR